MSALRIGLTVILSMNVCMWCAAFLVSPWGLILSPTIIGRWIMLVADVILCILVVLLIWKASE